MIRRGYCTTLTRSGLRRIALTTAVVTFSGGLPVIAVVPQAVSATHAQVRGHAPRGGGSKRRVDPVVGDYPSLRSAHSRTYPGPHGTFEARISLSPQNYRAASGTWQPIENGLVTSSDPAFAWQNRANAYRLRLPRDLQDVVSYSTSAGSLSWQLMGASATGTLSRAMARYSEALPGVDAEYSAAANGAKESLILRSPGASSSFVFALQLPRGAESCPTEWCK
jgi:hypothetical protein